MTDAGGERMSRLVPRATPREVREGAEQFEKHILEYINPIVESQLSELPNTSQENALILGMIQELLREKTFDYFKRRLDREDVVKIREEHRDRVKGLRISDEGDKTKIQALDEKRQGEITALIAGELDRSALRDEIQTRFPRGANLRALLREYLQIRTMRVEDILEAHTHREYVVNDSDLERLRNAPLPTPMFEGQILIRDEKGQTYSLVQLTNPDHLAQETRDLRHCINEQEHDYRHDLISRRQDGTMKSACFSVRVYEVGKNPSFDEGKSVWTLWYDRESQVVQQVKGYRNRLVDSEDDIHDQAVLRALGKLLTDPVSAARFPIRYVKDLHMIPLDDGEFLVAGPKGVPVKKKLSTVRNEDRILSGHIELNANSSNSEILKAVALRGVRCESARLIDEGGSKLQVYVDAILAKSRRDLAGSVLSRYLLLHHWTHKQMYRFSDLIRCSRNGDIASNILHGYGGHYAKSLIGKRDFDFLFQTIADAGAAENASKLLERDDIEMVRGFGSINFRKLVQTIIAGENAEHAAKVLRKRKIINAKLVAMPLIYSLVDVICKVRDGKQAGKVLQHIRKVTINQIGKRNISALVSIVRESRNSAAAIEILRTIFPDGLQALGSKNVDLLVETIVESGSGERVSHLLDKLEGESGQVIGEQGMQKLRAIAKRS